MSFHGEPRVAFSATSIEAVRGILSTSHVFLNKPVDERDLWRVYRKAYAGEPFMRIVKESSGVYRYPEPKILSGTNYCDVGFELDERSGRVVVLAALDNLMKGAAGQAVQSFNIRFGFTRDNRAGVRGPAPDLKHRDTHPTGAKRVLVIKIGGSKGVDMDRFLADVPNVHEPMVLVHGANAELNQVSEQLGHPARMVTSSTGQVSRYTDRRTMEIFMMVYCGKVNKTIVERLQGLGVNAVGLSALDGKIARGRRKQRIRVIEEESRACWRAITPAASRRLTPTCCTSCSTRDTYRC